MAAFPATPRMRQGGAGDFFRKLEADDGDKLPVWNGELYLELHRGTYTTQSRNKRANRKSEFLLHDAEFLATQAALLAPDYQYPMAALQQAWQLVCLNQFHDIIPGSSITAVYTDSLAQYAEIRSAALAVSASALAAIARQAGGALVAANPTSFARNDLAFWAGHIEEGQRLERADGTPVASQSTEDGTWLAIGKMAPFTVEALRVAQRTGSAVTTPTAPSASLIATTEVLENAYLRVELNPAGDVTRIFDKVNRREVLPAGARAGQFQAFEDRPVDWDAWDVDIFYDDKMWTSDPAASIRLIEAGPLQATLEVRRRILHSDYVQRISLASGSRQIDFVTVIDWRERHILLKAAFPLDVLSPVATYEIQWGNVQRPTHRNTSWDWARFESCAQKWVDLSEGGYGASLLNDCKYGHDIRDNIMRISLLRSPTVPDPEADQGEHRFAYSLLPHAGGWDEMTIAAAYALNDPIIVAAGPGNGTEKTLAPLLSVDRPNIVIETIKQAEDGNGIIVRLYECRRQRGEVGLTAGFPLAGAWRTNLLEEDGAPLDVTGNKLSVFVKPYQIVTLRLVPER
jgi:alpha-mannosidase